MRKVQKLEKIKMKKTDIGFLFLVIAFSIFMIFSLLGLTVWVTPDTYWGWMTFLIVGSIIFIILIWIFMIFTKIKGWGKKERIKKVQKLGKIKGTDIIFWAIIIGIGILFTIGYIYGVIMIIEATDTFWLFVILAIISYILFCILVYFLVIRGWKKDEESQKTKKVGKLGNLQIIELKLNIVGIIIIVLLAITGIIIFLGFLTRLYGLFTEREILLFYVIVLLLITVIIVLVIRTRSKSKSEF